jgi:hypothetical protein
MPKKPKQLNLLSGEQLIDLELEKDFQRRVEEYARLEGWHVYSVPDSRRVSLSGYPDLTMWRVSDHRLIFAELKREKGRLRPQQEVILDELRQLGIAEVYVWRPSHWNEILSTLRRP